MTEHTKRDNVLPFPPQSGVHFREPHTPEERAKADRLLDTLLEIAQGTFYISKDGKLGLRSGVL
jgi:hypothetical protein